MKHIDFRIDKVATTVGRIKTSNNMGEENIAPKPPIMLKKICLNAFSFFTYLNQILVFM